MTDNSFIDHYAREMQPSDVNVYFALERFMNCHTRSTFVGTAKIADVLNISQRSVQRSLKALENLKLIRIVQTATVRNIYVVPVPPLAKSNPTPLFDEIPEEEFYRDTDVAQATCSSFSAPAVSPQASSSSSFRSGVSRMRDTPDAAYKEEQNDWNKTNHQDSLNNNETELIKNARILVKGLMLPSVYLEAAKAAIRDRVKQFSGLPIDKIVVDIVHDARNKKPRNMTNEKFLDGFVARNLAETKLAECGLPTSDNLILAAADGIKAEMTYAECSVEAAADRIASIVSVDMSNGVTIDKYYFENCKWRTHGRTGKGQQQFERIKRARDEAHAIIDARFREVDN